MQKGEELSNHASYTLKPCMETKLNQIEQRFKFSFFCNIALFGTSHSTYLNSCSFMCISGILTRQSMFGANVVQVVPGAVSSVAPAGASFKIQDMIKDFDARSNLQVCVAMIHIM